MLSWVRRAHETLCNLQKIVLVCGQLMVIGWDLKLKSKKAATDTFTWKWFIWNSVYLNVCKCLYILTLFLLKK